MPKSRTDLDYRYLRQGYQFSNMPQKLVQKVTMQKYIEINWLQDINIIQCTA